MWTFSRIVSVAVVTLAAGFLAPTVARAESFILSGMFDGAEPAMHSLEDLSCAENPMGYRLSTFQVSTSGAYKLWDALGPLSPHGGVSVVMRLYEGSFDPAALGRNVAVSRVPGTDGYSLTQGITYVLVVQQTCSNVEGAWAVAIVGNGSISSDDVVEVPDFTRGRFSASDPKMGSAACRQGKLPYKQAGPIRVIRGGTYYFTDFFSLGNFHVSLQVYTEPVSPANPEANRVVAVGNGDTFRMNAGQDYYFVTVQCAGPVEGEFAFVIAPSAPFRINPGVSGSWYNPETPGQGFFLTAYEKLNQVFLGWFTYAKDPLTKDEFGHRWMTAFGDFEGASADLDIELTSGGGFDTANPEPEQSVIGEIRLEFTDCSSGEVIYGWDFDESGTPTVSGVIPIQRLANDSVELCESLYAGPGMPGPL